MYSGKDPPSLALLTHLHNNQALLEKLPSIPHIVKAKVKAPVSLGEKVQIPALLCLLALEGRERGQRVSQGHQASQRPKDRAEEREVWAQPGPERTSFKSRRKPADLSAAAWNAPACPLLPLLHPRHTQEPPGLHFLHHSLQLPHLLNTLKS